MVDRSLVLVVGSGRSGTSLFTGVLQRLGFHVPEPEVPADVSNPRGFAESQWVVDFHSRMLESARVQTADARPSAWATMARVSAREANVATLRRFLEEQYAEHDHIAIKDPRLTWFLPLWQRCAADMHLTPATVTMLRHPAAVVDSKNRYYGGWQGNLGRTAGWLNTMLFTERATRESPRMFVRYEDLLSDWTEVIARVGDELDLSVIRNASAVALRSVHQFIDPGLSRSSTSWGDIRIPEHLRLQADHVWELLQQLASKDSASGALDEELDQARDAYVALYQDAEGIAQSSIATAKLAARPPTSPMEMLLRSGPKRLRRAVPVRWRRRVLRAVRRLVRARQSGQALPTGQARPEGQGVAALTD